MNGDNFAATRFYSALEASLRGRGMRVEELCGRDDKLARRIVAEYGAMFVASETVALPPVGIFRDEAAVSRFQEKAGIAAADLDGVRIELQRAALAALIAARETAAAQGLRITPRGGAEAARRSFADTVRLWDSRFLPGLEHWRTAGKLGFDETERLRRLSLTEQIEAVLDLESNGVFFSKDRQKSILYSVAAPGASQHLAMLAFDAAEFADAEVRRVLAAHNWFRTVNSDLPHFTFLGIAEGELPGRGLHRVETADGEFWLPDLRRD